jgi:hypothetical protein
MYKDKVPIRENIAKNPTTKQKTKTKTKQKRKKQKLSRWTQQY